MTRVDAPAVNNQCPRPAASRRQQFSDSISETSDANYIGMSLRERTRPGLGIIEPCLPSRARC
jgi:hypothetical protein